MEAKTVLNDEREQVQKRPVEEQEGKNNNKQNSKKRKKQQDSGEQKYSPYKDIVFACKANLPEVAIEAFEHAMKEEVMVPMQMCHSVLFLCMGGENWDKYLRARYGQKVKVPFVQFGDRGTDLWKFQWHKPSEDVPGEGEDTVEEDESAQKQRMEEILKQYREVGQKRMKFAFPDLNKQKGSYVVKEIQGNVLQAAQNVLSYMKDQNYSENEMSLTARARLAALEGDIDQSYALAQRIVSEGMHVKLRNFHPALIGFMLEGKPDKVLQVAQQINEQGIDLTEPEFGIMAETLTKHGSFSQVVSLLYRFQKELAQLQGYNISIFKEYFAGERCLEAFKEGKLLGGYDYNEWNISKESVQFSGECAGAGGKLKVIDLESSEWADFLTGLEQLARKNIGDAVWSKHKQMLDRRNAKILIDGANVAMFGQSGVKGQFNWKQIRMAVQAALQRFPGENPLVFLNVGRVAPKNMRSERDWQYCDQLKQEGRLFVTPKGSNDDWYWLYAVVKSAQQGYLISNDELRDHIFQLIRPKYFLKWKDRHQIRYQFDEMRRDLVLLPPPDYTTCVQELENGAWMFPTTKENQWMCVRPVKSDA